MLTFEAKLITMRYFLRVFDSHDLTRSLPLPVLTRSKWLAYLMPVLLVLSFAETRNHAEETVVVITNHHPTEAHPIYLIAVPPQEKMAPRPLNIPAVSARQAPPNTHTPSEPPLPFPMSAAPAVRTGSGLIENSADH